MPCVPIAGKQMGSYFIPQLGAGVWIEFEQGNPDYPIWVGGYWPKQGPVRRAARWDGANFLVPMGGEYTPERE